MTRVNLVPVQRLNNRCLLSEHREIKRIPNAILNGKANVNQPIPEKYTLGKGHVTFFYNKIPWLYDRYCQVHDECIKRGFNVQDYGDSFTATMATSSSDWVDWKPTYEDILLNEQRIVARGGLLP